jgi:hypothetical protein
MWTNGGSISLKPGHKQGGAATSLRRSCFHGRYGTVKHERLRGDHGARHTARLLQLLARRDVHKVFRSQNLLLPRFPQNSRLLLLLDEWANQSLFATPGIGMMKKLSWQEGWVHKSYGTSLLFWAWGSRPTKSPERFRFHRPVFRPYTR